MRCVEILNEPFNTSIATYSKFLGESLQKSGLDVTILAERKDVLPQGFDPDFVSDLKYVECWSRNENFEELIKTVKKENVELIHLQNQFGLFPIEKNLVYLLSELKKLNKKIVVTLHDVIPYSPQMSNYFGKMIDFSDKIIVHNHACLDLMLNSWKCPKEKLAHIWHGTKLIEVPSKEEARKILGLPLDAKIILSWGFIWESKGIQEIIEVFAEIVKTVPNAIFIHAGGLHPVFSRDDYLKNIIKKAFRLGITPENFRITGFINEEQIKLYFGCCDLIVLNYHRGSASASGAAHRALGSRKPILGTDDPCLEEVSKYTINRFDKVSLYKGILKVLEDKNLQEDLIVQAEKAAFETSWEKIAGQHKKLYELVLN